MQCAAADSYIKHGMLSTLCLHRQLPVCHKNCMFAHASVSVILINTSLHDCMSVWSAGLLSAPSQRGSHRQQCTGARCTAQHLQQYSSRQLQRLILPTAMLWHPSASCSHTVSFRCFARTCTACWQRSGQHFGSSTIRNGWTASSSGCVYACRADRWDS